MMRQLKFRALVTLDAVQPRTGGLHPAASEYPNHTRALMIRAEPLRAGVGPARCFPAELWRDDDEPALRAGDRAVITARVTGDQADAFLDCGQHFVLWSGGEVGHGIIYRRVLTDYGPS